MRAILAGGDVPAWLDATAQSLLRDAQQQYKALQLHKAWYVVEGHTIFLFLWEGDQVQEALSLLLSSQGLAATNAGVCIEIKHTSVDLLAGCLLRISALPCPSPDKILGRGHIRNPEKWDWVLPDDLFFFSYASRALALDDAYVLCQSLENNLKPMNLHGAI